jgi:hypothetical protein
MIASKHLLMTLKTLLHPAFPALLSVEFDGFRSGLSRFKIEPPFFRHLGPDFAECFKSVNLFEFFQLAAFRPVWSLGSH